MLQKANRRLEFVFVGVRTIAFDADELGDKPFATGAFNVNQHLNGISDLALDGAVE